MRTPINRMGIELAKSLRFHSPDSKQKCDNCKNVLREVEIEWKEAKNIKAELCLDCLDATPK